MLYVTIAKIVAGPPAPTSTLSDILKESKK